MAAFDGVVISRTKNTNDWVADTRPIPRGQIVIEEEVDLAGAPVFDVNGLQVVRAKVGRDLMWSLTPHLAADGLDGLNGNPGFDGQDGAPGLTDGAQIAAALDAAIGTGWRTGGGGGLSYFEAIDMAAFTGIHDIDVTGLKRLLLSSHDTVLAVANSVRMELSSDGGLTWLTGSADYLRVSSGAALNQPYMLIDGSASTVKKLFVEVNNLDTSVPAHMRAVEFASARKIWDTLHQSAVAINRVRLLAPAGVSGTIYVNGS